MATKTFAVITDGYQPLYGDRRYASGSDRAMETSGPLTVAASRRGASYRIAGYQWHGDRDISREYEVCHAVAIAATLHDALTLWERRAVRAGMPSADIRRCVQAIREGAASRA